MIIYFGDLVVLWEVSLGIDMWYDGFSAFRRFSCCRPGWTALIAMRWKCLTSASLTSRLPTLNRKFRVLALR